MWTGHTCDFIILLCVRKSTLNHQTAQGSPPPIREENLFPKVSGRVLSYFSSSILERGDSLVVKTEPTGEETYLKTLWTDSLIFVYSTKSLVLSCRVHRRGPHKLSGTAGRRA